MSLLVFGWGAALRLAHPGLALPWYDEFRTVLHASGHDYDALEHLLDRADPLSAEEVQKLYLEPGPNGFAADAATLLRAVRRARRHFMVPVSYRFPPEP